MKISLAVVGMSLVLGGCATKNYGRQGELTDFERQTMSCREIDLETAKVDGFLQHVDKESEFDGRSVLSFLGDFGIGNMMEKDSAVASANKRLVALNSARMQKGCGVNAQLQPPTTVAPATTAPTEPAAQSATARALSAQ